MAAQFGTPISIVGVAGAQGTPGISLIPGDGPPSASDGNPGDSWLDLLTGDLYSPKGATSWGNAVRNLTGPQGGVGPVGPSGAALLQGYQPPANTVGQDGDSYFCQQNAGVYGPKANGAWPSSPTSLIGPPGPGGDVGTLIYPTSDVPDNSMGRDGDFALDTVHNTYYGPKANGSWGNAVNLVGPAGPVGPVGATGQAGSNGATFIPGHGQPQDNQGNPGDYFIDQDGAVVYGPKTSAEISPWPSTGFSIRGATGSQGPVGPAGFMGQNGKSFIIATSDPTSSDGDDGDSWFNKSSGFIYGPKASGAWDLTTGDQIKGAVGDPGPVGPVGPAGQDGVGFLTGTNTPDPSVGSTGQYFYDSSTFTIFGPKDQAGNTGWGSGVSLVGAQGPVGPAGAASTVAGPQGPRGTGIYLVNNAPNDAFGSDGDSAVTVSGDVYGPKANGDWGSKVGSFIGPQGPIGPVGPAGNASTVPGPQGLSLLVGSGTPSASYGNNGDSFFDQVGKQIYPNKTNGAWSNPPISLVGAQGPVGATGQAGSNGTTLRYGNGAPSSSTVANDGDFFIDETNSRLYGPRQSGSWPSSYVSLVGPTGQAGPAGAVGPAGVNGSTIRTGTGAPTASNPATQVDGDYYFATDLTTFYGPRVNGTWPTSGTNLMGAVGPAGAAGAAGQNGSNGLSVLTGQGAPSSSLGVSGQAYIDTTNWAAYVKTSSGWSTGVSLIGPQGPVGATGQVGSQWYVGSAVPGATFFKTPNDQYLRITGVGNSGNGDVYTMTSTGWLANGNIAGPVGAASTVAGPAGPTGAAGATIRSGTGTPSSSNPATQNDGDYFFASDTGTFWGPRANGSWPSSGTSLLGPQGVAGPTGSSGLSVLTGSGAPASTLGAVGQAYIDTTAWAGYVKSSSGWSTATSLVGPQGPVGPAGPSGAASTVAGPAGAGILNGTGAPTSSNPGGTITAGSYYIRTDTTPNYLYGPYTTANGWPTTYQLMGGGTFQTTSGPPASTLGSVGDCAFDLINALFYPPKTSSGWTATPINMVGPTGATGPTSAYRIAAKGFVWLQSSGYGTANASTPVVNALTQSSAYSTTPFTEPMFAAGQIVAVAASCPGGTTACNASVSVVKNGTTLCTFSNVVACNSTATATTGYAKASSTYSFAAGDVLTMTAAFSASGGQCLNVTLYYLQNS